jgi:hypothetical protein
MHLEERMDWIAACLFQLRRRLQQRGFNFREPDEVLPGPIKDLDGALNRIRQEVGPVPFALEMFYRKIGSVNFLGDHPDWQGCEYPDTLLVYPVTAALDELNDFLSDRVGYTEAFGSFRVPIAPDYYHKENVSGGMWYGVAISDSCEDPPLLEEWHNTTFVTYLEICIHWAGFPGLELCSNDHTWPVKELTRGLDLS